MRNIILSAFLPRHDAGKRHRKSREIWHLLRSIIVQFSTCNFFLNRANQLTEFHIIFATTWRRTYRTISRRESRRKYRTEFIDDLSACVNINMERTTKQRYVTRDNSVSLRTSRFILRRSEISNFRSTHCAHIHKIIKPSRSAHSGTGKTSTRLINTYCAPLSPAKTSQHTHTHTQPRKEIPLRGESLSPEVSSDRTRRSDGRTGFGEAKHTRVRWDSFRRRRDYTHET